MLPPNYKSLRNFLIITSSASRADSLHRSAFISPEPDKDTVSSGIILPPHISYPAKVRWRRSRKDSAGNNGDPPLLLHNSGGNGNHFVNFRLVGTKSNRDAMGARIRVLAGGLSQIREIAGGAVTFLRATCAPISGWERLFGWIWSRSVGPVDKNKHFVTLQPTSSI